MFGFIASMFRKPEKSKGKRAIVLFQSVPAGGRSDENFKLLKKMMNEKDPDLYAEFRSSPASHAVRLWKAKYPEDFTEVFGNSSPSVLCDDPRRHIIMPEKEAA